tara:strand:+ start:1675 stop:2118 length:444 start_codon:yes stop_codon:yes gene_type:complete
MSSNRLRYDTCAYETQLSESVDYLSYLLDPSRYYRCSPCRPELGIVGGNNVSQVKGNLVDLENDLRGQTRLNTNCPAKKNTFMPTQDNLIKIPGEFTKSDVEIDANKLHLPPCQMIRYEPVPLPPGLDLPKCPPPAYQMQFAKKNQS